MVSLLNINVFTQTPTSIPTHSLISNNPNRASNHTPSPTTNHPSRTTASNPTSILSPSIPIPLHPQCTRGYIQPRSQRLPTSSPSRSNMVASFPNSSSLTSAG